MKPHCASLHVEDAGCIFYRNMFFKLGQATGTSSFGRAARSMYSWYAVYLPGGGGGTWRLPSPCTTRCKSVTWARRWEAVSASFSASLSRSLRLASAVSSCSPRTSHSLRAPWSSCHHMWINRQVLRSPDWVGRLTRALCTAVTSY